MNVLDLFSGIGGFSLGLERAGMRTVAFCEIDPYCRSVLRRHWPDVPIFEDVRDLSAQHLTAARIGVDLICGGFPCQDISVAGKGAGIGGERSGLWSEYARLIGELRPSYVIVENVAALLGRGLDRVLGDMAALGYDAEWHCIPAFAVGAPHRRDRIWIVAYPASRGQRADGRPPGEGGYANISSKAIDLADTAGTRRRSEGPAIPGEKNGWRSVSQPCGASDVADTRRQLLEGRLRESTQRPTQWLVEPGVGRVAYGISSRVDRLRALGNSLVPQIPEIIGRAIMASDNHHF